MSGCSKGGQGGGTGSGGASATGGAPTGTGGGMGTGGRTSTGGRTGSGGAIGSGGRSGTGGASNGTGGTSNGSGGTSNGSGDASVLQRNNHLSRDGHYQQPMLTKDAVTATSSTTMDEMATFTGAVWASPLYVENGPGGKGIFIVATTGNDVFALDETDGHVVWTTNIGSSPTANQAMGSRCGYIHPLGILGTPVIDASPSVRRLYVAGAIGTTSITGHEIHALSLDDGTDVKTGGWPLDVTKLSAGSIAFSTAVSYQNQRAALSLVGGILYVAYGGHSGDCGGYHGWVIAVDTTDPSKVGAWTTSGAGEAIWAAGGLPSDGTSVFAVTGNNTAATAPSSHLDSEEVIRFTGMANFDKSSNQNYFYPTRWQTMDGSNDYDFGSSNALYLEVPGASPSTFVVAVAKDGHLYLLDSKNLGGLGGQVVDFLVAGPTEGMLVRTVPAAYTNGAGAHVLLTTESSGICPNGVPTVMPGGQKGRVLMSVLIPPGSPPVPTVEWCAAMTAAQGSSSGPTPIVTTSDEQRDPIVWTVNGGALMGYDAASGATVFTSSDSCPNIHPWTSPIAVKGRIVVAGDGNLCSWSPH